MKPLQIDMQPLPRLQIRILEGKLMSLLAELGPSLTGTDVEEIQKLINANELGVAFENFCDQLYERDAACSCEQVKQISSIGAEMGINPEYWKHLVTS